MMTRMLRIHVTAGLLAVALAGCSRSAPEGETTVEDTGNRADVSQAAAPTIARTTPPADTPAVVANDTAQSPAAVPVQAEPAPLPDEQMMDDAAASGMTARASRQEPSDEAEMVAENRGS